MQTTVSSTPSVQSDLLKTMQPQSAQNMYVSSTGTNNAGNVRTNQQSAGGFLRGPPAASSAPPPRNNARHVPLQTMYQQTMHQGVVTAPTYQQYHIRQPPTYQAPPFPYTPQLQQQYYYQYYPTVQQPQAHQRTAVGVNTAVGVGGAMSVQNGPNGPLSAPSVASQSQIPLTAGTVIAGGVPPGTGAVLSVATPTGGQQVGVPPLVGVMSSVQPAQPTNRRRKHALEIIDPNTNKNILEDLDLTKNRSNSESDYPDQIATPVIQQDSTLGSSQPEHSSMGMGGGVIVMNPDIQSGMPYDLDLHSIPQQRDMVVSQTPVVSAMTNAPSVEILPTPQKPRHKKILQIVPPKDDQIAEAKPTEDITIKDKTTAKIIDDATNTVKAECVQQQQKNQQQKQQQQQQQTQTQTQTQIQPQPPLQHQYQPIQVPQEYTQPQPQSQSQSQSQSQPQPQTQAQQSQQPQQPQQQSSFQPPAATVECSRVISQTPPVVAPVSVPVAAEDSKVVQLHDPQQPQSVLTTDADPNISTADCNTFNSKSVKESSSINNKRSSTTPQLKRSEPSTRPTEINNVHSTTEREVKSSLPKMQLNEVGKIAPTGDIEKNSAAGTAVPIVGGSDKIQTTAELATLSSTPGDDIFALNNNNKPIKIDNSKNVGAGAVVADTTVVGNQQQQQQQQQPLEIDTTKSTACDETDRATPQPQIYFDKKPIAHEKCLNSINIDNNDMNSINIAPDINKHFNNNNEIPDETKPLSSTTTTTTTTETAATTSSSTSAVTATATVPPITPVTAANIATENTTETSKTAATNVLPPGAQLLITYNEGQWSPLNPDGAKRYTREQLLRLREAKASRVELVVSNASIVPQPSLMPAFVRNNHKRVQSMMGSIGNNRGNDGGGFIGGKQSSMSGVHARGSMKGMIHVNLSLNQDVKLNETDNAWRPRVLTKSNEIESDPNSKDKREKDDLIRRVRGILNKLTPEKFDTLVEEIIKLKIDTPDKMEDVMILVFEKAIDEPNFSVWYAKLCFRLIEEVKARDERMEQGTKSNLGKFRNALLDKTEREFTQNVTQSASKEKKLQPIIDKIKVTTDIAEKAELETLLEEEERKIRRRSGGTVRFIGELFMISMLTGKIIHSCIDTLLNPNSEDMLECLCKLLTTVGAKFEHTAVSQSKESTRFYSLEKMIVRMQAIASKTDKDGAKISSRVRFMLQDVIDLRKNKWQSTRNEAPKTMGQIEKEAKTEQMSSQYLNYSGSVSSAGANGTPVSASKRDDRDRGTGRYGDRSTGYVGSHSQRGEIGSLRRQQPGGGGGGGNSNIINSGHSNGNNDDREWHVQTSKGSRTQAVDTNKLEGFLNQNLDMGNKKMGNRNQYLWNIDASRQAAAVPTMPTNSFAALSSLGDSIHKSMDRDRGGPRNKGSYNKNSMERDRYGDRGMHSRNNSSQASRENSSSRSAQPVRGVMNAPGMQKSTSQSKYGQQMQIPSRLPARSSGNATLTSGTTILNPHQHSDQPNLLPFSAQTTAPSKAPNATFEEPTKDDLKTISSVVSEMVEIATTSKTLNTIALISCINRIGERQRCGFLYYILTDYLHLSDVGPVSRRFLGAIVASLIANNCLSKEHFRLAYEHFVEIVEELIVDIPELWLYIFEFIGPLLTKDIITISDMWNQQLKQTSPPNLKQKFLKSYLTYCTREIGPSFTRDMWRKYNLKWTDFVAENETKAFIETNKFEYIENDVVQPKIEVKENREKHINKVVERIEHLLKEGSNADSIIDYINGNIVDIDKQFIRSSTAALCNAAIVYKDAYRLETDFFQKVCIPVLQRFIDSHDERELECLYAMQLLVHELEHPRGLLSELFGELYDADIIPQDAFVKWRDSKDQSAGKGVAVKGLNPFFNHMLSSETSDENN